LQLYSLGYASMIRQHDYVTAIPLFERAIALDPNFAMAYARLAICLYDQDQPERAAEGLEKAFALSQRVSERERLYIAASREAMATGNMESARQSYEVWSRIYPNDQFAVGNLGVVYGFLGQYQKARIALERAWDLNRANAVVYSNVVTNDLQLGDLAGAKSKALRAKELNVDSSAVHLNLYFIHFLQNDLAGMRSEVSQLSTEPGWSDRVLYREAQTAAYGGQFARARDLIRLAAEAAEHDRKQEVAAAYEAEGAIREALVANFVLAKRQATDALSRSSGKEVTALAALALALAGEPATANRLTSELAGHFPEDTAVQWTCLPVIRAATALAAGSPTGAVEELTHARYEMGETFQIVNFKLYPPYLRGLAYLTLRQGAAATVEFRKVTDHPGLTLDETIAPLARLGLARARAMVGDDNEAKNQYAEFLSLWRQGDGDLAPLAEARLEYAKLR
jgi:eukaryotic-like serine/threonine-protein kinase